MMRYFEGFSLQEVFRSREYSVSKEEIIGFAKQYDHLSFHTGDVRTSKVKHLYTLLTAGGAYITAICMRLFDDSVFSLSSVVSSHDYIQWPDPIKQGDSVSARFAVESKRILSSRDDLGIVKFTKAMTNQEGDIVFTSIMPIVFRLRCCATQ